MLRTVRCRQQKLGLGSGAGAGGRDQLVAPVKVGQAFWLTEEEARARYGSKLAVTALGAQVKSGVPGHVT